jgi:hypothetical protein
MGADQGAVVIEQLIAKGSGAGEIVVEPGVGMLAAMGPVVERVVAPQPVIVFHVAAAEAGGAALDAGAEAAAEIDGDAPAQHRGPGLPDQMADGVIAV